MPDAQSVEGPQRPALRKRATMPRKAAASAADNPPDEPLPVAVAERPAPAPAPVERPPEPPPVPAPVAERLAPPPERPAPPPLIAERPALRPQPPLPRPPQVDRPNARPIDPPHQRPMMPQGDRPAPRPRPAGSRLDDLYRMPMPDLFTFAEAHGIREHTGMTRAQLIVGIVRKQIERGEVVRGSGTLEVLPDGYGFLRSAAHNYLASPEDIYVSPSQIRRMSLRTGLTW